jgi:hypothetical protein
MGGCAELDTVMIFTLEACEVEVVQLKRDYTQIGSIVNLKFTQG